MAWNKGLFCSSAYVSSASYQKCCFRFRMRHPLFFDQRQIAQLYWKLNRANNRSASSFYSSALKRLLKIMMTTSERNMMPLSRKDYRLSKSASHRWEFLLPDSWRMLLTSMCILVIQLLAKLCIISVGLSLMFLVSSTYRHPTKLM